MKTTEITKDIIGKRVAGIFTAMSVTGTITEIWEDEYSKGVMIRLDHGVQWGEYTYTQYMSTARKSDGWGNLENTRLIN